MTTAAFTSPTLITTFTARPPLGLLASRPVAGAVPWGRLVIDRTEVAVDERFRLRVPVSRSDTDLSVDDIALGYQNGFD